MEKINEALLRAIEKAGGYLEKGIELASEQVPEIIQQLIMWNMLFHAIMIVVGVVVAVGGRVAFSVLMKLHKECGSYNDFHIGARFAWGVGSLIGAFVIVVNLLTVVKIWVAPKVWLIEYAADLAKGR